jgi:hypothetical protein
MFLIAMSSIEISKMGAADWQGAISEKSTYGV